jgi:SAM-dependent methyltransferase
VFVHDPCIDFASLYNADYYAGRGADPAVDYHGEMDDPRTVRVYEWRGVSRIISHLLDLAPATRWLDYGCGLGGLVTFVGERIGCSIVGFEEGYAAAWMATAGVPHIGREELADLRGTFDVVTAVEVLEHALDPVAVLREIRDSLKPGGILFLTTGNAEPHGPDITHWSYTAVPDVHVGFFEPASLAFAIERAGLEPVWAGSIDGLHDVIRFKVLKSLRIRRRSMVERSLPWRWISPIVDARHRVSAMPLARRP